VEKRRLRGVALIGLSLALLLSACGGDDKPSQDALDQARQEGARSARQNERIKQLEKQVKEAKEADEAPTTVPSVTPNATTVPASSPAGSYISSWVPYSTSTSGFGYLAEVPSGGGWSAPLESLEGEGARLRTTMRGPDGTLLLIDYTPNDVPALGGSYDAVSASVETNFGPATEYIFSRSESLPDCNGRPCADFFIDDGSGGGWAVLGGGPSLPVAEAIATHVAQSINYGE
jgi:hypothetical protein